MGTAVYHVLPSTDGWHVERDGLVRSVHHLKADAVFFARWLALGSQPSRVVIERADGTVRAELSYRRDTLQEAGASDGQDGTSRAPAAGTTQLLACGHFGQW